MTGIAVALLLALAGITLALPRAGRRSGVTPGVGAGRIPASGPAQQSRRIPDDGPWRSAARRTVDLHELPLFVHQLAGLLRAGRPPQVLWEDMERVHADGRTAFAVTALPVIATARRAAELGLSVPDALRQALDNTPGPTRQGMARSRVDRLWVDLAGCLTVAERSGAPLTGILEQYAAQLDAQLDGLSARETALAGPRATVVLLAWLPALGLVLAFALGVNPLEVLFGSSPGRLALAGGVLLMLVARLWSRRLVARVDAA
ncbi:type II secretion system F family protein [Arthrobacter sp. L77]|uniref:type II secretion system F family protein n=1 Tax=Arthrobacter sp. L77 TaxID=1496689 RepID=UPI00068E6878|nr:type II secretion system F family protein [Arthrobacter sp. L77]